MGEVESREGAKIHGIRRKDSETAQTKTLTLLKCGMSHSKVRLSGRHWPLSHTASGDGGRLDNVSIACFALNLSHISLANDWLTRWAVTRIGLPAIGDRATTVLSTYP